jgi:Kef-type K+ transport system membrane component KefB
MAHAIETRRKQSILAAGLYALMLAGAVAGFFAIRHWGSDLVAPMAEATAKAAASTAKQSSADMLLHVLLALGAVIIVGQTLGAVFKYLNQPPVIGEVIGGILLGPSFLGYISPAAYDYLLPSSVAMPLGMIAQLGVILYMFIVGLELNGELLRERGHTTVAISHASIVAPFVLGSSLALWLYPTLSYRHVDFTGFALFLGVSMSVTAFPVLARILTDRQMAKTELGVVALTCAATDDVTAWCLLALVVGVVHASVGDAVNVVLMSLGYLGFMFLAVRPIMNRFVARMSSEPVSQGVVAVTLIALLASAAATELIGVHAVFGAFLLGAVIPHDSAIARELTRKLSDLVAILFLPAFFAFTGMRTRIGLVSGGELWLMVGVIVLVATLGKFGGTLAAARLTGLGWRDSMSLGILMNTRGLMELVVLNFGLDLGVISETLFAMMVLMALVTTVATTPVLAWLQRGASREEMPGV